MREPTEIDRLFLFDLLDRESTVNIFCSADLERFIQGRVETYHLLITENCPFAAVVRQQSRQNPTMECSVVALSMFDCFLPRDRQFSPPAAESISKRTPLTWDYSVNRPRSPCWISVRLGPTDTPACDAEHIMGPGRFHR